MVQCSLSNHEAEYLTPATENPHGEKPVSSPKWKIQRVRELGTPG